MKRLFSILVPLMLVTLAVAAAPSGWVNGALQFPDASRQYTAFPTPPMDGGKFLNSMGQYEAPNTDQVTEGSRLYHTAKRAFDSVCDAGINCDIPDATVKQAAHANSAAALDPPDGGKLVYTGNGWTAGYPDPDGGYVAPGDLPGASVNYASTSNSANYATSSQFLNGAVISCLGLDGGLDASANCGTSGQVATSAGPGMAAYWGTITVPSYPIAAPDAGGIVLPNGDGGMVYSGMGTWINLPVAASTVETIRTVAISGSAPIGEIGLVTDQIVVVPSLDGGNAVYNLFPVSASVEGKAVTFKWGGTGVLYVVGNDGGMETIDGDPSLNILATKAAVKIVSYDGGWIAISGMSY